jgi:hypothetical protein
MILELEGSNGQKAEKNNKNRRISGCTHKYGKSIKDLYFISGL